MDNILKNKLNDYDAGFNESAWNDIEDRVNDNNTTSKSFQNKLQNYDAGLNKQAWGNISGRVAQNNVAFKSRLLIKRIASAAVIAGILVASIISFNIFSDNTDSELAETPIKNNNPIKTGNDNQKLVSAISNKEEPSKEIEEASIIPASPKEKTLVNVAQKDDVPVNIKSNAPSIKKEVPILASLNLEKNEFCVGEAFKAKITGVSNKDYFIKIDNKWVKTRSVTTHYFAKPGNFNVELYVASEKGKRNKIVEEKIVVHPNANTDFNWKKSRNQKLPITEFKAQDKNLTSVTWSVGSKVIGTTSTAGYVFINKGKYPVKLVACNEHGCTDSNIQTLRVLKAYNLMATQIFNPDNERWLPLGLKQSNHPFDIRIISDKGDVEFSSDDSNNEWDGILTSSGKRAKNGAEFYWVAKVQNEDGTFQEYGGSFIVTSSLR